MERGDLLRYLAAHRDSNDRLMARARTLSPEEVESSTDPQVLRIRRMALAVRGEVCRMRSFIRLVPLGDRVLWGRMSPHHDVGFEVADFFARRFPGTIVVLGDGKRSWTSLYAEGALLRQGGGDLSATLAEISRIMDQRFEGVEKDEKEDMMDSRAEIGHHNEENSRKHEEAADLWSVYYRSQDVPRKAGRRPFGGRISRRSLRSAGLAEKGSCSARIEDFI